MDHYQNEKNNEAISLISILKILWKNRWLIVIVSFIFILLFLIIMYPYTKKLQNNQNTNHLYSYQININEINYLYFKKINMQLNFDLNTKLLSSPIGNDIKSISISLPNNKVYKDVVAGDFPISQFIITVNTESEMNQISQETMYNFIKSFVLYIFVENNIETFNQYLFGSKNFSQISLNEENIKFFLYNLSNEIESYYISYYKDPEKFYNKIISLINSQNDFKNNIIKDIRKIDPKNMDFIKFSYLSQNNKITYLKVVIDKIVLILFFSFFLSIFFAFIIDFFKKYWFEIISK